jgi:hypothetical protein
MARLATLVLLLFFGTWSHAESWNFTPADYRALLARGARLQIASDSAWFHPAYAKNLLDSLDYILAQRDGVVRSDGVNGQDLYHGHVLCRKPSEQAHLIAEDFDRAYRAEVSALQDERYDVPLSRLADYLGVITRWEKKYGEMLRDLIGSPRCAEPTALYHSFEEKLPPGMQYRDPRRNIITPLGGKPGPYNVPGYAASSYTTDYVHVLQFLFLVDERGEVHLSVGPRTRLTRITGKLLQ